MSTDMQHNASTPSQPMMFLDRGIAQALTFLSHGQVCRGIAGRQREGPDDGLKPARFPS